MLESRKDIKNIEKKITFEKKNEKKKAKKTPAKKIKLKKTPKPRDCCSEGDLIATVADRVGVAAGGRQYK